METGTTPTERPAGNDERQQILKQGRNCWRIENARRLSVIIDAADYFSAVKAAMLRARHSIYLIGWDFDIRIKFEPERQTMEGPNRLGRFLRWIERNRPEVNVYILKWDLGILQDVWRGALPILALDWMTGSRVHLKLDGVHPPGAAHHQKIVVVDDVLAFCGGIDMTADRWDTPMHLDDDPRRTRPSGRRYGPWHDAATMVDGEVAKALGELARARWLRATGRRLPEPPPLDPIWPAGNSPDLIDVEVAIARTHPRHEGQVEVREIEHLHLDAIAGARRTIYCESQYFASSAIADAMAARLAELGGPEIVVINPVSADGYLEAMAMDTARARLIATLREADRENRFRILSPVTALGRPIYVHAKVMVIDDTLLRVGSSNFNNRSMGFDTECDLAVEATCAGERAAKIRAVIGAVRNRLLAEHLDVDPERLSMRIRESGSLLVALDSAMGEGRSLRPYEPAEPGPLDRIVAENGLVDPERPPRLRRRILRGLGLQPGWIR